jgi:hypothetical protein
MAWEALSAEVAVEMRGYAEHGWLEHDAEVYRVHGIVRAKKLEQRSDHERARRALDRGHRESFNAYHREYQRKLREKRRAEREAARGVVT